MKRMSRNGRLVFAAGLCALLLAFAPDPARAAAAGPGQDGHDAQPLTQAAEAQQHEVRPRNAKLLMDARAFMLAGKYDDAKRELGRLYPQHMDPYERALLYRMEGYVAYGQKDFAAAVSYLEMALDEHSLSNGDASQVLFQIAQLHASQQEWPQVVASLQRWLAINEDPGSVGYFLLARAYFEMKDLDSALAAAQKAVDLADKPQQSLLQLLLAIRLTKQDYAAATPVAVELLTRYPQCGKSYWLQLSSLYGVQNDLARALAVLELADRQGYLTDDAELLRLARLSQAQDLPMRAVRVLDAGLNEKRLDADVGAYQLLGNSWILAREPEKGEPALERAAELSPGGDLYVRLAQVELQNEQWAPAADALKDALSKGGLEHPGVTELLLGIAYYNTDRIQDARGAFLRARETEKERASAQAWIDHIDHELQKSSTRKVTLG